MKRGLVLLLFGLAVSAPSLAAVVPRPGAEDPRIQSVGYDPDQVVLLQATLASEVMLEFGPGERLENVAIGDSLGWQVTPNKRADLLFIKPLDPRSVTNMTVVTSERRYVFELRVAPKNRAGAAPYIVRFTYPPPATAIPIEPEPEKPPEVVNTNYVMTGAAEIRPLRIFDDGHLVYFQWPADVTVPAIFAVGPDKGESVINYVLRGPYVVVEQLNAAFVLRSGKLSTMVVNRAFASTQVAGAAQ